MCAYQRKSWAEKLNTGRAPAIEKAGKDFGGVKAGQLMLVPTPKIIDDYIRSIPKGKQVSFETIRKDLAAAYHAETTCPLTTGIFIRIAAEAAYEEYEKGKRLQEITPFWRAVSERSPTAKKLSFGTDFLIARRQEEGII